MSTLSRKITQIKFPARQQILHCDFHENLRLRVLHAFLAHEHGACAIQHVVSYECDRPEAPALDQQRLFVKSIGSIHDLAVGTE